MSDSLMEQQFEGALVDDAKASSATAVPLLPTLIPKHGQGASGLLSCATIAYSDEAEHGLDCPSYPWPHKGILSSYDHASIRRGHQVYQQVCASCHQCHLFLIVILLVWLTLRKRLKLWLQRLKWLMALTTRVKCLSPGKLSDRFLSHMRMNKLQVVIILQARHNGQNYVFALLTGYRDPPAGVTIREGLHYNPYFPGGAIAMPKMLNDGAVEYEDGTPATEAQMGKDVVTFLSWAAEPEMEERKLMGFKWIFVLSLALLQAGYYRRLRWSVLKSRKLVLDVVN
ncbi:hypothetical protein DH2020_013329 [Rehmannia glutinosa]|uniref:Uncharacterized protein n=1 Tax=Rehmannia glutinosa TaxID=99300 RepID=A0ABR0X5R3_REHGL